MQEIKPIDIEGHLHYEIPSMRKAVSQSDLETWSKLNEKHILLKEFNLVECNCCATISTKPSSIINLDTNLRCQICGLKESLRSGWFSLREKQREVEDHTATIRGATKLVGEVRPDFVKSDLIVKA